MDFMEFEDGVLYRPLGPYTMLVNLLKTSNKLDFVGQCQVLVLKGSVEILGYEVLPTNPPFSVYSPKRNYNVLTIHVLGTLGIRPEENAKEFLIPIENGLRVERLDYQELKQMEGVVILLMGIINPWCDGVRKYCIEGETLVGPSLEGLHVDKALQINTMMSKIGFKFLTERRAEQKRNVDVPPEWHAILDSVLRTPTTGGTISIATFGGKGVGKSTFNRWIVNRLLTKFPKNPVLFVDLDIGQPELTPPGVISVHGINSPLLGPNFTHLREPLKSFFLGTVNVADEADCYTSAMRALAGFIQLNESFQNHHVVLNTMGFCTGIGVQFAVDTIKLFRPNSVVQIRTKNKRLCFPFLLTTHNVTTFRSQGAGSSPLTHRLFEFATVCQNDGLDANASTSVHHGSLSSRHLREIVMGSYFAPEIGSDLLGTRPRVLPFDKLTFGSKTLNYTAAQILEIINGNVVALCFCSDQLTKSKVTISEPCNVLKLDKTVVAIPIEFYGYAIVRGIDLKEKKLFVITPVSEEILLNSVNCILTAGNIGLPPGFRACRPGQGASASGVQNAGSTNLLHTTSKRQFVPKRTSRNVLSNALL